MHARREDVPVGFEGRGCSSRTAEWGGMTVAYQTIAAGIDTADLLKDLPGGCCGSRHWGYLLRGRLRVTWSLGEEVVEEVVEAGQAYYFPAGHSVLVEEEAEFVEFSPSEEYGTTLQASEEGLRA